MAETEAYVPTDDQLVLARTLAGDPSADDALVGAYLRVARDAILAARNPLADDPSSCAWEARYDTLLCEVAADLLCRRGAEGETAHRENGVDRTWASAGISRHLLQRVVPRGRVMGA